MSKRNAFPLLALCAVALPALYGPPLAAATGGYPQWTVTAYSAPTNLPSAPGSPGLYRVQVQNTGSAPSDGTPVSVKDLLPPA